MKQLKCIVSNYSVVENNGLIDINFQQSINIKPNSTIALDKISMEILPNPDGTLILQAPQTIIINNQISGAKKQTPVQITLPAGTYTYNASPQTPKLVGSPDLLMTLNNLCNGILDGIPLESNTATTPELDYGLGYKWLGHLDKNVYKLSLHVFQQEFAGDKGFPIELTNNNLTTQNMSISADGTLKGVVANLFGDFSSYTNSPIIQGCFNGWLNMRMQNIVDNSFRIGLSFAPKNSVAPVIQYGLACYNDTIFLINEGLETIALDKSLFFQKANLKLWFWTEGGSLMIGAAEGSGALFWSTAFGQLTNYDFNIAYRVAVVGTSVASNVNNANRFLTWRFFMQPNITTNEIGTIYNKTPLPNEYYLSQPNLEASTPNRVIQLDFSQAPLLINSLGFSKNILQGKVSFTDHLVIDAPNGIDFSNWYDIALDVLNLNLESYVGSSGVNAASDLTAVTYKNMISGKKNTLAYFLIQRLNQDESVFFNESKQHTFLSLNNQESINVSSLQFRIYNVATQTPINFSTASFNIFIGDGSSELVGGI